MICSDEPAFGIVSAQNADVADGRATFEHTMASAMGPSAGAASGKIAARPVMRKSPAIVALNQRLFEGFGARNPIVTLT
jgi:hypothetical protein